MAKLTKAWVKIADRIREHQFILKLGGLLALIFFAAATWYGVSTESNHHLMTVAFLNIGQGDAIYIDSPDHHRMIIDGGPSSALLGELSKVMPFYARSIDAIMITNPDKDHYAGFIDLLKRYSVGEVFEAGTKTDTATYQQFIDLVHQKHIPELVVKRGMIIHLGNEAAFTVLFPDRDVSAFTTNDGSIIGRLAYGSTSVMFTGDAPIVSEEHVVAIDPSPDKNQIASTILKEGHHGSRTSASEIFFKAVHPDYSVISAGKDNQYGFPHKETVDLLNKLHIPMLVTFEKGTIVMKFDGKGYTIDYK